MQREKHKADLEAEIETQVYNQLVDATPNEAAKITDALYNLKAAQLPFLYLKHSKAGIPDAELTEINRKILHYFIKHYPCLLQTTVTADMGG